MRLLVLCNRRVFVNSFMLFIYVIGRKYEIMKLFSDELVVEGASVGSLTILCSVLLR